MVIYFQFWVTLMSHYLYSSRISHVLLRAAVVPEQDFVVQSSFLPRQQCMHK